MRDIKEKARKRAVGEIMDVESGHKESDDDDESNEDHEDEDDEDNEDHENHEDDEVNDREDDEDDKDENGGVPSMPPSEMIADGNGGVRHHEHAIQPSNERTIQPSNKPAEILCNDVIKDSPLTITTGMDLVLEVRASPVISIYTYLLCPSLERVSIYDNWPLEECYTVREADIPQETRVVQLVRRLNTLKDSSRSDFRDFLKRFNINKSMSRIGDNCRWIVSTEGDCLFTFKLDGKMWIKIYDTVRTSNPNSAGD